MVEFRKSYSQVAEDLLASYLLNKEKDVLYVDIGCLWPKIHSNTYRFYENGGSGICIDPNPDVETEFKEHRPRDVFVNCGVSQNEDELNYYMFENPVFNTFSQQRAMKIDRSGRKGRKILSQKTVKTKPLKEIINAKNCKDILQGRNPDFLSIDVEGFEFDVLSSIDFQEFRPTLITFETAVSRASAATKKCISILEQSGYTMRLDTGHDVFMMVK